MVKWWILSVLLIEPLIGLFLLWNNDSHHLIYSSPQLWHKNGLMELKWQPGTWYFIDSAYMFLLILIGIWFLIQSISHNGDLHRRQIGLILKGAFVPLLAGLFSFSSLGEQLRGLDLFPLFFTVSGIVYFYAISQRQFLDLIPVAHSTLIKSMTDGVVVLDLQDRIVEMNQAAGQFLGIVPERTVGFRAKDVLTSWRETTSPFWNQPAIRTEIVVAQDIPRYIDLNITPLMDGKKRTTGRMMVFRDITSRKNHEALLQDTNKKLREQLTEIRTLRDQLHEQATRDPLTNLFNRRYLEEKLSQELARASRENYPVCVIMMDIDRFKRVNDTCGHKTGDEVLQALSTLIVLHIRRFDAACRYGGEEFVIVMPKLSLETARERAEFLRREFSNMSMPCSEKETNPTLSIGLAAFPFDGMNGEQLLDAADQALYAAKGSGRNRVVVYSELEDNRETSGHKT